MNKINKNVRETLKKIPSIDDILLKYPNKLPQAFLKLHINNILNRIRKEIIENKKIDDVKSYIYSEIQLMIEKKEMNSLRQVINGTGIILHTGLGRAPISKDILIDSIEKTYPYTNLELNLETGKRGERNKHIDSLLNSLCNSSSSLIVNNNAAAVMLMLNSLCENGEVIISRGQQVEIGGSFRIPDVILKSQCKMVEVGTTNKTHLSDYTNAINEKTSAILYVHTSNFKVVGFTNQIDIKELSELAHKNNIPLLVDLGSGSLADYKAFNLPMEKLVSEYISKGVDVLTFSGDKLLGGPQSGIIVGSEKHIKSIHQNPIYRAVRCDKVRISIMESILRTYYSSKQIDDINLSISLFKRNADELISMAKKIISKIKEKNNVVSFKETFVEAGSGSLPTEKIPSVALVFKTSLCSAEKLNKKFLGHNHPVVGYINSDKYFIDLKAIPNDQISKLIKIINEVLT